MATIRLAVGVAIARLAVVKVRIKLVLAVATIRLAVTEAIIKLRVAQIFLLFIYVLYD